MVYLKVLVGHNRYKSNEPLTYESPNPLPIGSLVRIPLKNDLVLGVVAASSSKPKFSTKQLQPISSLRPLPEPLLNLARWMSQFYATPLGSTLQLILPSNISDKRLRDLETLPEIQPSNQPNKETLPPLTKQQTSVLEAINQPNTYLLHGETGSGKTRIYLELIQKTLKAGRSAIVLTPEIGLTSQLLLNLQAYLPDQVVLLHSQLTAKDRELAWLKLATAKKPQVVIGPRSALFSPLKKLGLIVVDEAHDSSYKQDQTPRYSAIRVAAKLASDHNAVLVLGSATPNIEDYFMAEQRQKPILRLTELARGETTPINVETVDLKDRSLFKGSSYLSIQLIKAIHDAIEHGEQTLLYLNRRGTSRLIVCENCGWQAVCPHCDIPLIYHGDDHSFRCHTCGFKQGVLVSCPDCGQPSIVYKSIGTKAVVQEAQRIFPEARIARFDTDNQKSERLEANYNQIRNGEVDILIGTQTLSKGLDLPLLTTLGIVVADSSLSLPDFSAGERTYQELSQVLGRIGRGHGDKSRIPRAFIQTYQPENPILQTAINKNWSQFYKSELANRQKFNFPPYAHLLKINCRRATSKSALEAVNKLAESINKEYPDLTIDGPAPAFHEKSAGKYNWQIVVKSKQRAHLIESLELIPKTSGWSFDLDPSDLL